MLEGKAGFVIELYHRIVDREELAAFAFKRYSGSCW